MQKQDNTPLVLKRKSRRDSPKPASDTVSLCIYLLIHILTFHNQSDDDQPPSKAARIVKYTDAQETKPRVVSHLSSFVTQLLLMDHL